MARVRVERLHKRYRGGIEALREIDLDFPDGEFTCILGPSGCGKSTILKLIAGIEEATSGRVLFDDDDVTHVTPERRDVAMVFQSYGLYPNMTAGENICFPLMLRRMPVQERRLRLAEVAELLGIQRTLDRHPRMLSGGERQRVALARAIVRQPRVFLLDEPISNLDAHLRASTREELKRIHARLKATFIYVTHDQDDAEAMGDRVVVMSAGAVQQVGSPSEIYHQPGNRFVASFVGRLPMTMIQGAIVEDAGRAWFEAGSLRLDLGPATSADLPARGNAILGLRPEAVLATGAARPSPNGHAQDPDGVVTLTEVSAPDHYATVRVGEHLVRARMSEEALLSVDDRAFLTIDRSRMRFFDPETGDRIVPSGESARASQSASESASTMAGSVPTTTGGP
jgi:multiple sugar transport system ATP-binding protein